jgi:hypothetical protein
MIQSAANSEWTEPERQEVIAEALHHPESAEECAAQQARFHAWLKDNRYQHLWPMLERLTQAAPASLSHGSTRKGHGNGFPAFSVSFPC